MNFRICLVGEKPEKFYIQAIKEYEKRLSRYCKIQLVHQKNAEQLQKKLPDKAHRILVTPVGQMLSSEELADKINTLGLSGSSDITIWLGAPDLPHDESIALSPLDMDFGLQTTLIFEQIYRSYRILKGEPYHK